MWNELERQKYRKRNWEGGYYESPHNKITQDGDSENKKNMRHNNGRKQIL